MLPRKRSEVGDQDQDLSTEADGERKCIEAPF